MHEFANAIRRAMVALPALAAIALFSGCATLTTSSSQTVTVTTEPPGAACTFTREGKVIGIVNPTPGSLSVQKSHAEIAVDCAKPEYLEARGVVGSKFQAMTFGNILFGGIIGLVVDAASGATAEYAGEIRITLVPAKFADARARDAFFDRRREEFVAEAAKVKERIKQMCVDDCERQLALADEEERAGLARIEAGRASARLTNP